MRLSLSVVFILLIAGAFVAMMHIKNGVQDMRSQSQALLEKREGLAASERVLEAEHAYLSRPERLAVFAQEKGLREIHYNQMVTLPELRQINAPRGR